MNRRNLRKICFHSILAVLILLTVSNALCDRSVSALIKYGYKEGDDYRFSHEMSSTSDTEEGKTTSTVSYDTIVKIRDIDEDVAGYKIRITMLVVNPGQYGGPISEQVIEGNRLMYGGGTSASFNLFTSTDWDDREDEWKSYVDGVDDQKGYRVTEDSASNGVFILKAEIDVSRDDSNIDYDDDGDNDAYKGWLSVKGEYDSRGVLKSNVAETYRKFNDRNSITYSEKVDSGGKPLISTETLLYIDSGIVVFIVAFVLGFFFAKQRRPKMQETPATSLGASVTHCIHCGAALSESAVYCIKCGKKQTQD